MPADLIFFYSFVLFHDYQTDLWCRAGLCAWDFLANHCPAVRPSVRFILGSNLASPPATGRHRLSVLPGTHPRCCLGNRPNVDGGAGAVHVCVARCYRELTQVAVALLHWLGERCVLERAREKATYISLTTNVDNKSDFNTHY